MTILNSELRFYKSEVVSDDDSNGGRMSAVEAISGAVNNVWPHALSAERAAGSERFRKVFAKNTNDNDETLLSAELWNDIVTKADDYIIMFPGTQTDTQADWQAYSGKIYGCALLSSDVNTGDQTISVQLEDPAIAGIFTDTDKIRLTNMAEPGATTGTEDILTVSGDPTLVGDILTITVVETVANPYLVSEGARLMSLYACGDIVAEADPMIITSASGTYDEAGYPVLTDNIASVEDTFTLTFTDATHFTCVGSYEGDIGSGDTGSDFLPLNSDFSRPYFTIEAAGWGGTWAAGDTVVLPVHPAAAPFVLRRTIPPGSASLAGNLNVTAWSGESA